MRQTVIFFYTYQVMEDKRVNHEFVVGKIKIKSYCQVCPKKEKKKGVDMTLSSKWVMVDLCSLFKDAIMARHLQPRENVSIVRGRGASNRTKIWVNDFSRRWHYPWPQACIHGSILSIYWHTAASAVMPSSLWELPPDYFHCMFTKLNMNISNFNFG